MIDNGYVRSEYDYCFCYKKVEIGVYVYLFMYVDDYWLYLKKKFRWKRWRLYYKRKKNWNEGFIRCKEDFGYGNRER